MLWMVSEEEVEGCKGVGGGWMGGEWKIEDIIADTYWTRTSLR